MDFGGRFSIVNNLWGIFNEHIWERFWTLMSAAHLIIILMHPNKLTLYNLLRFVYK